MSSNGPGERPPRGRSIQAGSLCYINGCGLEAVPDGRLFISGRESRMFFTIGAKGLAKRGFPPRGRSIQPGRLCYINGGAVEMVAELDASSASDESNRPRAATTRKFGQNWRPVDTRYSLEGYAT